MKIHKYETDKRINCPGIGTCGLEAWSGEIIIVFIIRSSFPPLLKPSGNKKLFLCVKVKNYTIPKTSGCCVKFHIHSIENSKKTT